jgi:hypothetical protein
MDRTIASRLALGSAVLAQAACFAVVIVVLAVAAASGPVLIGLTPLVALLLAGCLLCSVALPVLVRHAQGDPRFDAAERRRWLFRLALWGPLVMPLYWRRYLL